MRIRIFLSLLLILTVAIVFLYGYRTRASTLCVTVYLDLSVGRESNSIPGIGWILGRNTSVSLVEWPQSVHEKVDVSSKYAFNETRTMPLQFAVSICLDETNKTVLTPNLTTTGGYSAVVSSIFPDIGKGTHTMVISVYIPGVENHKDQLKRIIEIP